MSRTTTEFQRAPRGARPVRPAAGAAVRRWALVLITLARLGPLAAHAQTEHVGDERVRHVTTLRARLSDPQLETSERRAVLQELLQRRASLIDERPAARERPFWMVDQVEDLLLRRLPLDGAGLATLLGVPTSAQRELVETVAARADALGREAETDFDRVARAIESDPDVDDMARRAWQRRIADDRGLRLRMLRGLADLLGASAGKGLAPAERRRRYERAADSMEAVAERLEGPIALRAMTGAGLAAMRLGARDRAVRRFEQVLAGEAVHPADRFAAELGRTVLTAPAAPEQAMLRVRDLERRYRRPSQLFYRLLLADRQFLIAAGADADGTYDPARLAAAVAPYRRLLEAAGPAERGPLQAEVLGKLAAFVEASIPVEGLPPLVVLARAETEAAADRHVGAIALYERVLADAGAAGSTRATALLGLGRSLYAAGRLEEAADRWVELAREHPADTWAERSIELAASTADALWAGARADAAARRRLRAALELLLTRYPNLASADRWSYRAGELALEEGRLDDARRHLDEVARGSDDWVHARYLMLRVALRKWKEAPAAEQPAAAAAVLEEGRRALEAIDAALAAGGAEDLRTLGARSRHASATVLIELGRHDEADELLGPLERAAALPTAVIVDEARIRLRLGRDAGRMDVAVQELARLIATEPAAVRSVLVPLVAEAQAAVESLLDESRREQAAVVVEQELAPLADLLRDQLTGGATDPGDRETIRTLAGALRSAGRWPQALRLYDELLATEPNVLPDLVGRAECLFGIGGDEALGDAIVIYKRIAALGAERGGQSFWRAQLRTLQILDRVGRNTHRIGPQIERLRRLDPDLGGERWRRQFDALEREHS